MAQISLFFFGIASLKCPRLTEALTIFATIDMVCHSTLRVHGHDDEHQYRFLVILFQQAMF